MVVCEWGLREWEREGGGGRECVDNGRLSTASVIQKKSLSVIQDRTKRFIKCLFWLRCFVVAATS